MKLRFSPPHFELGRLVVRHYFVLLIIFLFAGCMQEEEMAELEREVPIEINPVKKWFDTNRTSLRNEATDIRAREMTKALILPFLEKEPDWSKFSVYQFNDGRKVYEIHLKNLSGIMPKEFFERFGSSGNDLIEESLLFVEKANGDLGYSVLVARYYSYGEKSEGMTYHKIPSHWSGRIDMFSYAEEHLRSFEVEEGNLISHIRYEMKEESNKASNLGRSLMTHCIGYWIDFPYYGNGIYHVYSHQSIYVQHCWDMPTAPVGDPSTDPNHDEGSPSGGGSGAGSYGGVGPSPTYGIDDPLNYCNGPDCFPFPTGYLDIDGAYWESSEYIFAILETAVETQWQSTPTVKDYNHLNSSEKLLHILNHLKFNIANNTNFKITQIMSNVPRMAPSGPFTPKGGWYESAKGGLIIDGKKYLIGYVFGNQEGYNYVNTSVKKDPKFVDGKYQVNIYFQDVNFPGRTSLEIYLPQDLYYNWWLVHFE